MNENLIGERIAFYRKRSGMSQEKVAECLEVSRQAVTKWEGDVSKPSSDNLIKLARLFNVDVEVLLGNKKEEDAPAPAVTVTVGKTPWILIGISFAILLAYILSSAVMKSTKAGTVILGFIVCVPIQLFLHIYLSNAVKNESFTGIAGYDSRIDYNADVLKKLLIQINLHIGISSTVFIFLNCTISLFCLSSIIQNTAFIAYIAEFISGILINNYRMTDSLYNHHEDKERARKGMPATVVYLVLILMGILITIALFEINGIENNSPESIKKIILLILGLSFASAGYVFESRNISKWQPGQSNYKPSRIAIFGALLCVVMLALMVVI